MSTVQIVLVIILSCMLVYLSVLNGIRRFSHEWDEATDNFKDVGNNWDSHNAMVLFYLFSPFFVPPWFLSCVVVGICLAFPSVVGGIADFFYRRTPWPQVMDERSDVSPSWSSAGDVVGILNESISLLPNWILSRQVADGELGDALEIVHFRRPFCRSECFLVLFFLWRVFIAILHTQRARA